MNIQLTNSFNGDVLSWNPDDTPGVEKLTYSVLGTEGSIFACEIDLTGASGRTFRINPTTDSLEITNGYEINSNDYPEGFRIGAIGVD